MNLRAFEILTAVAEMGGMTAAAEHLGLTQSAVSQAMRGLEEDLGIGLFDRSVRPPALTLAGSTVVAQVRDITERVHDLQQSARFHADDQLSLLRIGMLDSFAGTVGPSVVDKLRHMVKQWMVFSGPAYCSVSALVDRKVDFIITSQQIEPQPDIMTVPLFTEPYFLLLPSSYRKRNVGLKQLADEMEFIRYASNLHISGPIERYLQGEGVSPPRRYQFDSVAAAMAMVAAGFGWTILFPLGLLRPGTISARNAIQGVQCRPLPKRGFGRTITLAARNLDANKAIAQRIANATIEIFKTSFLPTLKSAIPAIMKEFKIG
jgi:DNA-binding transcriptional LysR family regulator